MKIYMIHFLAVVLWNVKLCDKKKSLLVLVYSRFLLKSLRKTKTKEAGNELPANASLELSGISKNQGLEKSGCKIQDKFPEKSSERCRNFYT